MTTYIKKLSYLNILKWAQNTLSEQELQQFMQAFDKNNQLWDNYELSGVIADHEIISETLISTTYNTEISVPVEEIIRIAPGQTAAMASEMIPWMDHYIAENGNPVIIEP
jgi:hypothetical protein